MKTYLSFESSATQMSMQQAMRAVMTPMRNIMIQRRELCRSRDQEVFFATSSLKMRFSHVS